MYGVGWGSGREGGGKSFTSTFETTNTKVIAGDFGGKITFYV